ncbi:hypothetical protein HanPI659440_Chr12g0471001 [Helianthus annuus]|nr:hypothetical protein HanIR_Chr12g0597821 [Helianthus annuus]KAJ0726497.1 hypothetical protein HanPI659440_Chr12g0471001 [Helianthus annuus]
MNIRFSEDRCEDTLFWTTEASRVRRPTFVQRHTFVRRHQLCTKLLFPTDTSIFDRFSTLEDSRFCSRTLADLALPSIHFRLTHYICSLLKHKSQRKHFINANRPRMLYVIC